MSPASRLKSIDFYRKIPRDLTEASLSGASLSILAAVAMIFLFGMEFSNYLSISTTTIVVVDQSPDGDLLRINFNFSFPALSCEFASVDVSDVLGTARFNLSKTIRKFPIDNNLQVVGPQHHPGPVPTPTKHGNPAPSAPARLVLESGEFGGALVLSEDSFGASVLEYPVLLVNFYAPWCPWSQRLEPAWEQAATLLAGKYHPETDGRIRMAKVDCTREMQLCRLNHIQGFPSIRIFRQGNDVREQHGHHDHDSYYGERDTNSLLQVRGQGRGLAEPQEPQVQAWVGVGVGVQFAETLVPPATIEGRMELEDRSEAAEPHEHVRRAPQAGGCNIDGFVLVKKVPGNLMVSAHSGAHSFDPSTMNMTHLVHQFSYGRPLTRRKQDAVERLLPHLPDDHARINGRLFRSQHDNVTHDHFLQVVMTEVSPLRPLQPGHYFRRQALQSYDYTVHSNTFQAASVPTARFHYELSPMQIMIKETKRSFWHFITNVCAIVGGIFTVAGIADGVLHGAASMVKKIEIGKLV